MIASGPRFLFDLCGALYDADEPRDIRRIARSLIGGNLAHFEREARLRLIQTRANNTTLIPVRTAPETMQIGVSAGKKSPLLSRAKAQAPASSISPQNPVATAGSMPLVPVGSVRGKSGKGSRLKGDASLCGFSAGSSAGMAEVTLIGLSVYSGSLIFARMPGRRSRDITLTATRW